MVSPDASYSTPQEMDITSPESMPAGLLIPPLPCYPKSVSNKENDRQPHNVRRRSSDKPALEQQQQQPRLGSATRNPSAAASSTKRHPFGLLTPKQTSEPTEMRRPHSTSERPHTQRDSSLFRSSPALGAKNTTRRVLRSGETMESFFCFFLQKDDISDYSKYKCLCQDIADGPLADDSSSWRQVLELAMEAAENLASNEPDHGTDLIRLHRRATLRFSIDPRQPQSTQKDVLMMWLLYAKVQAKYVSVDEARSTYRHIQNQPIQLGASFYIAMSEFEEANGNIERAKELLQKGVSENVGPSKDVEEAARRLKVRDAEGTTKKATLRLSSQQQSIVPPLPPRKDGQFRSPTLRGDEPDLRQSTVSEKPLEFSATKSGREAKKTRESDSTPDIKGFQHKHASPSLVPSRLTRLSKHSPRKVASATKRSIGEPSTRSKRTKLSSRLTRVGLSGKAKRIDPETSFMDNDESESEQDSQSYTDMTDVTEKAQNRKVEDSQTTSKAQKITKVDLSYMWNWDPSSRGNDDGKPKRLSSTHKTMEKIDETPTNEGVTNASNGTSRSINTGTTSSSILSIDQKSTTSQETEKSRASKRMSTESQDLGATMSAQRQSLASKANIKFLPLVTEDNILSVNDIPYAKLGVIGKGGSCKVYRALSESCSVVAIKKVKLAGMDKKAIEGYANEISLLQRLQGNPSIIQMFDSEVDLERESIYVVMEVGEVDLNHVLKQRALSSCDATSRERRSLNMNFIRLTWQQMLSAVHCIHEERIIHSDLKPANFLFVRGALKLIDFGIAKAIQSDETTNIYRDNTIGTLNYMSPEAILDTGTGDNAPRMKLGRASDVWSLGCILYEMVYGKTPFASIQNMFQKLNAITNPNYQIQFPAGVDEASVDVMKQCLRRQPDSRPPIVGKNGLLNEHHFLHSGKAGLAS